VAKKSLGGPVSPFSYAAGPCFQVRPLSWRKLDWPVHCRPASCVLMDERIFRPGNVRNVQHGKSALWGLGTPGCRNGGPSNGVPMRSHQL